MVKSGGRGEEGRGGGRNIAKVHGPNIQRSERVRKKGREEVKKVKESK